MTRSRRGTQPALTRRQKAVKQVMSNNLHAPNASSTVRCAGCQLDADQLVAASKPAKPEPSLAGLQWARLGQAEGPSNSPCDHGSTLRGSGPRPPSAAQAASFNSWADLAREPEARPLPLEVRPSRRRKLFELSTLSNALGDRLGFQPTNWALPVEELPSIVQGQTVSARHLAQQEELQVLGLRCSVGASPKKVALACVEVHVDTVVLAVDFGGTECWVSVLRGDSPVVTQLTPRPTLRFAEWFESALNPFGGAGETRGVSSLLSDLAYEVRFRSETRKKRRDPILGAMDYFVRYVCPKGSHGGEDEARLLEAAASYPLVEQAKAGTKPKRSPEGDEGQRYEQIRGELVRRNARLGFKLALRHAKWTKSLTVMDLISLGLIGIAAAVDRYKPELGNKFSTYATWWTRQQITRGILNTDRLIRLPCHLYGKDEKGKNKIPQNLKSRPISLSYFSEEVLGPLLSKRARELEERQDSTIRLREVRGMIDVAVQDLTPRERAVLNRRFGLDGKPAETLEEVGRIHGVTRERIRQIEARALSRLRKFSILRVLDGKPKPPASRPTTLKGAPRRSRDVLPSDPIGKLDPPGAIQKALGVLARERRVRTVGAFLRVTEDQFFTLRGVGRGRVKLLLKLQKRAQKRCAEAAG
jgi:RNA polymerase primary sigma factor